jgi:hypothetical protein
MTLVITLGSFQIFTNIRRDIRNTRCTTGVVDTGGHIFPEKFSLTTDVVHTGGKFATGTNDGGGWRKICHRCQQQNATQQHCRDANIRRDTNISGNTRSRRDVNNSRTPATAEKLIAA